MIETERLLLRKITEQDIDWFYQLNTNTEVMRYTGEECFADREQALQVIHDRILRDCQ